MLRKIASLLGLLRSTTPLQSSEFPYHKKQIEFGKIPNPIIKIDVKTQFGYLTFQFLVDSGADVTTIPLDPFAHLTGFKKSEANKTTIGGVEGKTIEAYPSTLDFRIGKKKVKLRCFYVKGAIMPLLGRLDFWEKYNISFNNKKEKIILEEI